MASVHPSGSKTAASSEWSRLTEPLTEAEAGGFLAFMFSDVARRTKPIKLAEAAGVVRFLKGFARSGESTEAERRSADRIADSLWGMTLEWAEIEMSRRAAVAEFLESHCGTYLAAINALLHKSGQPGVEQIAAAIRTAAVPDGRLWRRPQLISGREMAWAPVGFSANNDLSERIYVSYNALRRGRIRAARGRVAAALNAQGIRVEVRSLADDVWGGDEVISRVKQTELRLKRLLNWTLDELRGDFVDRWVWGYRTAAVSPRGE